MRPVLASALALLALVACSDPADFRPAKGVRDLPSVKEAYRVKEADPAFDSIGFIKRARSIEDIATTTANNGGTHYRVLDDQQSATVETDFTAAKTFGVVNGSASSRVEKHHLFTAEAYRCR